MEKISVNSFANGIKWRFINLTFTKGLSFVISVILARMIEPRNYGFMAIWSVIMAFGEVVVIWGHDTIVIQRKNVSKEEWNIVLSLCMFRGILLASIIFFAAPYIADYYKIIELKLLLRLMCIDYIAQPFIVIGTIKSAKQMNYKYMFIADFIATLLAGSTAILCALQKMDEVVLITNIIVRQIVYALLFGLIWKIVPEISFNKEKIRIMMIDGAKAMNNGILDLISSTINGLFIGKQWDATEVGYYNKSQGLIQIFGVESYNVIGNLLLPTFSSLQDKEESLKLVVRKIFKLTSYVMFPLMAGISICGESIILLLFTDKWLSAVSFLQIACVYYAFNPIRQLCMNLNYSLKKFNSNNYIEFVRLIFYMLILLYFVKVHNSSLEMMSFLSSLVSIVIAIIYILSIKRMINYSIGEIMEDILPPFVLTAVSLIPSFFLRFIVSPGLLYISMSVASSISIYLFFSIILKMDIFVYIINLVYKKIRS